MLPEPTLPRRDLPHARALTALCAVFVLVVLLKRACLNEPYYWDALGYVAGTSLDVFDNGLAAVGSANTGHSPLFSFSLAVLWRVFGYSLLISHLWVLLFAAIGVYFTYRIGEHVAGRPAAIAASVLTLANQVVFAQIGTLNVVTAVFGLGTAAVYAYLRKRRAAFVVCSALLYLLHQAAILFAVAFAAHSVLSALLARRPLSRMARELGVVVVSLVPIALWDAYITHVNGWFLNPVWFVNRSQFWATLGLNVVRHLLYDRTLDNVNRYNWVVSLIIVVGLFARRVPAPPDGERPGLLFALIGILHLLALSWSDDLPRYFMPALPFFYLAGTGSLAHLVPARWSEPAVVAVTLGLGALFTTNYHGGRSAPGWQLESNLEYADAVATHLQAARYLQSHYSDRVVVTCFPMSGELADRRIGYVSAPLRVSVDYQHVPPRAVLYDSPEASCRDPAFRTWLGKARFAAQFEQRGKRAIVYELDR
jgi:hypothetical protein